MNGWGNHWEPGEWSQEMCFHRWRMESAWADLVILELETIRLESFAQLSAAAKSR
jgi:hypothetical protein